MKIIAILQLVLAMVSSGFRNYNKEVNVHSYYYYIYNVTSYYCIYKPDAVHCKKYIKFVKDNDGNYIILKANSSNSPSKPDNLYSVKDNEQVNITFCKYLKKTDVTKNTLTIKVNGNFSQYTYTKLHNGDLEIWTTDACLDLYQNTKQPSLRDESKNICKNFTFPLKVKLDISSADSCKTAEPLINYAFKFVTEEGYNDTRNINQVSSDMIVKSLTPNTLKTWYVFKNVLGFAFYYNVYKSNRACMSVADNERHLYQCKDNVIPKSHKVCKKTIQLDLRADIKDLTSFYDVKTFLISLNRCSYIQKWDEGYEINDAIVTSKLGNLTLKKQNKVCNEAVWYTDLNGFVVSERELPLAMEPNLDSAVKCDHSVDVLKIDLSKQEDEIKELQDLLFYLIIFLIICVLWYIFNTVVNWYTLRKVEQRRTIKNKLCFMNCLSRSLTSRYIYFNLRDNSDKVLKVPNEELYEYMKD